MSIESKYRKGAKNKTVSASLEVDAWEILKKLQEEYELKSLSAAIRLMDKMLKKDAQ